MTFCHTPITLECLDWTAHTIQKRIVDTFRWDNCVYVLDLTALQDKTNGTKPQCT